MRPVRSKARCSESLGGEPARRTSAIRPSAPLALRIGIGILGILPLRRRGRAKSRHFDDFLAEMHVRQAKAPADQAAIAKQAPHLFRQGVGRHVEVLRRDAQQQIAHRAAHQKCLISRLFEPVQHFQGVRRDRRTRYRMLRAGMIKGGNGVDDAFKKRGSA